MDGPVSYPQWSVPSQVSAAMTVRRGGRSNGVYSSFNLATHVGDEKVSVDANRKTLVEYLQLPSEPLWLNQTHSSRVVDAVNISKGENADAVYTNETNVVLVIQVADCLPILVSNSSGSEIGAIHAGWRGLASGVIANTLDLFSDKSLTAWIGPGIGPCHYEVDKELIDRFSDYGGRIMPGNDSEHWQLDLPGIALDQLNSAGVDKVSASAECTFCNKEKYFSYRRDGECGRMAALIWINRDSET